MTPILQHSRLGYKGTTAERELTVPPETGALWFSTGDLALAYWDGARWQLVNIQGQGTLFLHEEAADVATYQQLLTTPADDVETSMTAAAVVVGSGEVLMKAFITYPTSGIGVTLIAGGAWHFVTWATVDNATGTDDIVVRVYKRAVSTAETELFNLIICPNLTTSVVQYEVDVVQPDFVIERHSIWTNNIILDDRSKL